MAEETARLWRTGLEASDVDRAEEELETIRELEAELAERMERDLRELEISLAPEREELEAVEVETSEKEVTVAWLGLLWMPSRT